MDDRDHNDREEAPHQPGTSAEDGAARAPSDKRLAAWSIGAGIVIMTLVIGLSFGLSHWRLRRMPADAPRATGEPGNPPTPQNAAAQTPPAANPGMWRTDDIVKQVRSDLTTQDKNRAIDMVRQFQEPPAKQPEAAATSTAATPHLSLADAASHAASDLAEPAGRAYDSKAGPLEIKAEVLNPWSQDAKAALDLLNRYRQAPTPGAKSAFVLRPQRCDPRMMDFYGAQHGIDPTPGRLLRASRLTIGDSQVLHLEFACPQRQGSLLVANFHRTRSGGLRLDWESFVAYSATSWPDLRQRRSVKPMLMRACATLDDYYNYEFADSRQFLSVKLRSPDGVHFVNGYCRRSTPMGRALGGILGAPALAGPSAARQPTPLTKTASRRMQRLSVVIAFPVTAQSNHCVEIKALAAPRWLLFDGEE